MAENLHARYVVKFVNFEMSLSLMGAMNKTYDITESRPWWKVRAIAIGLTIALWRIHRRSHAR